MNKILRSLLFFFIGISLILRLYNLNWGAPYYFHPDERNIASAVTRLHFPDTLNPEFFAYGSLPIYVIYFIIHVWNNIGSCPPTDTHRCAYPVFEQAIVLSRIFSAIFSLALLPLLYLIGKKIRNETTGVIALLLGAVSVGFIQFSHFGTFEMWLTFSSTVLFYLLLKLLDHGQIKYFLSAAFVVGILTAVKISSIILLPIPFIVYLYKNKKKWEIKRTVSVLLIGAVILYTTYILTNPFVLITPDAFKNSMEYESSVALGTLPVFYTGAFYDTIPILYKFLHVYPFLLNPLLTILFIPSFLYMLFLLYKTKRPSYLLLVTCYLLLFLSQAFLFAKWIRYVVPTLPFMYLFLAIAMNDLLKRKTIPIHLAQTAIVTTILISSVFAISYFISTFGKTDTRLDALLWGREHIPHDAQILSEVYDLGIVPFNSTFSNITLFNMYDLDNDNTTKTQNDLAIALQKADYIILPSQRIVQVRTTHQKQFPKGYMFYSALLNKKLSFTKVYETRCDVFCKITYLNDPIFAFEQTANVFDRPVVMIFKKHANNN